MRRESGFATDEYCANRSRPEGAGEGQHLNGVHTMEIQVDALNLPTFIRVSGDWLSQVERPWLSTSWERIDNHHDLIAIKQSIR